MAPFQGQHHIARRGCFKKNTLVRTLPVDIVPKVRVVGDRIVITALVVAVNKVQTALCAHIVIEFCINRILVILRMVDETVAFLACHREEPADPVQAAADVSPCLYGAEFSVGCPGIDRDRLLRVRSLCDDVNHTPQG